MNMRSWKTYSKPSRKVRTPVLTSVPDAPLPVAPVNPPQQAIFLIESGVPVPKSRPGRQPGISKYPFAYMAVGDSLFLPSTEKGSRNRLSAAARHWGKTSGSKFATRSVKGGVRIWRLV